MPRELNDSVEFQLAALRPAPANVGQANFYFRAGQASRDRTLRHWQRVVSGLIIALVAVAGYGGYRIHDSEKRFADALAGRPVESAKIGEPPAPVIAVEPYQAIDEPTMPYSPPMVPASADEEPTPVEVADSLELRRKILTVGVTYFDLQQSKQR